MFHGINAKFLRTPILISICEWLLLKIYLVLPFRFLEDVSEVAYQVKVYKGPCFSGPRYFRVWVPSAGLGFGRSQPEGLKLYQKESSAQVFYCEYSESFNNSFLYRTPQAPESDCCFLLNLLVFISAKLSVAKYRRSRSQMFLKIGVLKNFAISWQNIISSCNFVKKRFRYSCFPVKFAKF